MDSIEKALGDIAESYFDFIVDELCDNILSLEVELRDEVVKRINKAVALEAVNKFDPELKNMYYEEFNDIFGDSGEEEAIADLTFLVGRDDQGSVERLKYLTLWYDMRVKKGLYSGIAT